MEKKITSQAHEVKPLQPPVGSPEACPPPSTTLSDCGTDQEICIAITNESPELMGQDNGTKLSCVIKVSGSSIAPPLPETQLSQLNRTSSRELMGQDNGEKLPGVINVSGSSIALPLPETQLGQMNRTPSRKLMGQDNGEKLPGVINVSGSSIAPLLPETQLGQLKRTSSRELMGQDNGEKLPGVINVSGSSIAPLLSELQLGQMNRTSSHELKGQDNGTKLPGVVNYSGSSIAPPLPETQMNRTSSRELKGQNNGTKLPGLINVSGSSIAPSLPETQLGSPKIASKIMRSCDSRLTRRDPRQHDCRRHYCGETSHKHKARPATDLRLLKLNYDSQEHHAMSKCQNANQPCQNSPSYSLKAAPGKRLITNGLVGDSPIFGETNTTFKNVQSISEALQLTNPTEQEEYEKVVLSPELKSLKNKFNNDITTIHKVGLQGVASRGIMSRGNMTDSKLANLKRGTLFDLGILGLTRESKPRHIAKNINQPRDEKSNSESKKTRLTIDYNRVLTDQDYDNIVKAVDIHHSANANPMLPNQLFEMPNGLKSQNTTSDTVTVAPSNTLNSAGSCLTTQNQGQSMNNFSFATPSMVRTEPALSPASPAVHYRHTPYHRTSNIPRTRRDQTSLHSGHRIQSEVTENKIIVENCENTYGAWRKRKAHLSRDPRQKRVHFDMGPKDATITSPDLKCTAGPDLTSGRGKFPQQDLIREKNIVGHGNYSNQNSSYYNKPEYPSDKSVSLHALAEDVHSKDNTTTVVNNLSNNNRAAVTNTQPLAVSSPTQLPAINIPELFKNALHDFGINISPEKLQGVISKLISDLQPANNTLSCTSIDVSKNQMNEALRESEFASVKCSDIKKMSEISNKASVIISDESHFNMSCVLESKGENIRNQNQFKYVEPTDNNDLIKKQEFYSKSKTDNDGKLNKIVGPNTLKQLLPGLVEIQTNRKQISELPDLQFHSEDFKSFGEHSSSSNGFIQPVKECVEDLFCADLRHQDEVIQQLESVTMTETQSHDGPVIQSVVSLSTLLSPDRKLISPVPDAVPIDFLPPNLSDLSYKCEHNGCTFETSQVETLNDHRSECGHKESSGATCLKCQGVFKTKQGLVSHMRTHGPICFRCSICGHTAPFSNRVALHMREIHNVNRTSLVSSDPLAENCYDGTFLLIPDSCRKISISESVDGCREKNDEKNKAQCSTVDSTTPSPKSLTTPNSPPAVCRLLCTPVVHLQRTDLNTLAHGIAQTGGKSDQVSAVETKKRRRPPKAKEYNFEGPPKKRGRPPVKTKADI